MTDPQQEIVRLRQALEQIRQLEPVRMGDRWSWEEGLRPDDVFDIVDEALKGQPEADQTGSVV